MNRSLAAMCIVACVIASAALLIVLVKPAPTAIVSLSEGDSARIAAVEKALADIRDEQVKSQQSVTAVGRQVSDITREWEGVKQSISASSQALVAQTVDVKREQNRQSAEQRRGWRTLQRGMTEPQVRALLGEPVTAENRYGHELVWEYSEVKSFSGGACVKFGLEYPDRKTFHVTSWVEPKL